MGTANWDLWIPAVCRVLLVRKALPGHKVPPALQELPAPPDRKGHKARKVILARPDLRALRGQPARRAQPASASSQVQFSTCPPPHPRLRASPRSAPA